MFPQFCEVSVVGGSVSALQMRIYGLYWDKIIQQHLRDLNEDDYENIVAVIESLVDRKRHIDAEERRRETIEEMNKILGYENLDIALEGRVALSMPIRRSKAQ